MCKGAYGDISMCRGKRDAILFNFCDIVTHKIVRNVRVLQLCYTHVCEVTHKSNQMKRNKYSIALPKIFQEWGSAENLSLKDKNSIKISKKEILLKSYLEFFFFW